MRNIIVIGCPGAGKSTFARRLQALSGLPLFYLDLLWHNADGTHVTREIFDSRLRELLAQDRWIIDGNYQRTLESRLAACDTVFLLDYPVELCLAGAQSRIGRKREDLPWVETELDEEFRQWILDFPQTQLPQLYERVEQYREGRNIVVFHSREEAEVYLESFVFAGDFSPSSQFPKSNFPHRQN